ncbi:hypothetical protein BCR41DRAFT_384615 [Lobosporangium transversale]|uniref:Uncharacterized protein n=1 Tax=Lobosporangium transversale TaxID=64571 RepID=A0A1Y2GUP0_9FUNG|nr:hypothetical protein BCR41DRAFT_384615 [Lobosporangium transversale]ORZ24774.1 hypothetical protein BCR41DRAFT_384615 [Lobosporangium transversale]|eukprot:XP_021883755.1 hypothetical protein BCR41DRAFT_384615 [Lobosporangium transversale]
MVYPQLRTMKSRFMGIQWMEYVRLYSAPFLAEYVLPWYLLWSCSTLVSLYMTLRSVVNGYLQDMTIPDQQGLQSGEVFLFSSQDVLPIFAKLRLSKVRVKISVVAISNLSNCTIVRRQEVKEYIPLKTLLITSFDILRDGLHCAYWKDFVCFNVIFQLIDTGDSYIGHIDAHTTQEYIILWSDITSACKGDANHIESGGGEAFILFTDESLEY